MKCENETRLINCETDASKASLVEGNAPNRLIDRGKAKQKLCAQLVSSLHKRGQGGGRSGELM
jgi:hypothetical protein